MHLLKKFLRIVVRYISYALLFFSLFQIRKLYLPPPEMEDAYKKLVGFDNFVITLLVIIAIVFILTISKSYVKNFKYTLMYVSSLQLIFISFVNLIYYFRELGLFNLVLIFYLIALASGLFLHNFAKDKVEFEQSSH